MGSTVLAFFGPYSCIWALGAHCYIDRHIDQSKGLNATKLY